MHPPVKIGGVKRFSLISVVVLSVAFVASAQQDLAALYRDKLAKTVLPNIEFKSTTLQDAVEFLRQEGRRLDPTTTDKDWAGVPVHVEADAQTLNTRLTFKFSRIPLLDAFEDIAQAAGAKMDVDTAGVHVYSRPPATQAKNDPSFEASIARARAMYPDISNTNTPLGKATDDEIRKLTAANDPVLYDPRSAEIIATRVAGRMGIAPTPQAVPATVSPAVAPLSHDQAVAASKARVYAQYPELHTPGNAFYDYFVNVKTETQRELPSYFLADNWPEQMADECAKRWRTMRTDANQATAEERARAVALQNQIAAEQASRPTQRNGQPLPPNWIDPDEADARFAAQQSQAQLDAARNEADQARFELQQAQDAARKAADDARYEAIRARPNW